MRKVALRFGVNVGTISRWCKRGTGVVNIYTMSFCGKELKFLFQVSREPWIVVIYLRKGHYGKDPMIQPQDLLQSILDPCYKLIRYTSFFLMEAGCMYIH